ncbi:MULTISPECIES: M3 family oligoendopeptidase [unclassified Enterococcus]|uniref:M3 family oligoendopeptidase n=1 Tax=unclassified Enterococcus TaxID=2608891 RepID=UPI001556F85F|nr:MULTISPECIES: M3 family oligoendopeptidase [unclassified Enterococcus]MBS7578033.1 M3 family oligoendopeptidase [Enterococcus sp. MMGLQ5-2]MBS7585277.1 M3 family oligoendopeptidase [Enterococcus sp. MMGLQ5-1]NPD13134.1 M3 family oligoendopeptidase [Enterococcus sp. MMGLQ5-1]NPD37864.1 M3 family oligoendopeptidase [Enterococcus sp. MMGLQ5-2]
MTTLQEYQYHRPDFESLSIKISGLTAALEAAKTVAIANQIIDDYIKISNNIDTMYNLAAIRFSINMDDPFYKAEDDYWNEFGPRFGELSSTFSKVLVESPLKSELAAYYPETMFLLAESEVKSFSNQIVELKQIENQLSTQYNELIGSAQIEFQGAVYTLPQMTQFTTDQKRSVRRIANEAVTAWYVQHEAEFDRIYDALVKNRHAQALKMGYENYAEMSLYFRQRFGYDLKDIANYRQQILEKVVPVAEQLYHRQAKRNQLVKPMYYDWALAFPKGNAKPIGTTEEKVAIAQKMYHELSSETGEFFDFLAEHQLLDLDSKKGKQSGGYCTYIYDYQSPFIFANYNGTSGDVDVLTHEAGHAFQVYTAAKKIRDASLIWPTIEAAEIFSMSMEFITWPWMSSFFGESTLKYQFSHLSDALQFLPYGVLVDHFQQTVYENPQFSPEERKKLWRKLEKTYLPHKDYAESADLERGIYWFRQGHIFDVPFYYIDYTLAQVVAFQFWQRFIVEEDPTAWSDYLKVAEAGGTKTFLEILEMAHLKNPFEAGALDDSISAISNYLEAISETELN